MERLTERNPLWIDDEMWERACEPDCEEIDAVYRKLKEYEDAEEQGLLLLPPCRVGDTVYVNNVLGCGESEEYRVIRVDYHSTLGTGRNEYYIEALLNDDPGASIGFYDKEFGKNAFLTREKAEAKLKEMEDANVHECD